MSHYAEYEFEITYGFNSISFLIAIWTLQSYKMNQITKLLWNNRNKLFESTLNFPSWTLLP